MTSKAESLVDALIDASRNTGSVVHEYRELSRHIEELERKAQAYDNLDATAESMCRMSVGELQRKLASFDAMQASLAKFDELFPVRDVDGNPSTVV